MANKIQTIMRTAAMIYAQEQSASTIKSVKRRFVNAVLVNADNTPHTIERIITALQKDFELVIQEKELQALLDDRRYYELILGKTKQECQYYLPNKKYIMLKEKSEDSLDEAIKVFSLNETDFDIIKLRDLLHRYLYSLLNSNIKAYSQLLEKKGEKVSPMIDSNSFDEVEIELINKFIRWDNLKKDQALYELVNYSIDYALAINSIDPHDIVTALKNKKLYLDNALIYRALGINGDFRKQRVLNLLQRCVDSGQTLLISSTTRQEFNETIDYHISHLKNSTPFGKINPELFHQYTGGYSIYQFYHEWRRTKSTYALELFRLHIKKEYDALLKKFNILEDFSLQFKDDRDFEIIERYADEIMQYKRQKNSSLHVNDAKNMLWIEYARKNCNHNVQDTKYYFVTSDRRLQEWDLSHSQNQPITMLPSQWLALLLKYYSQSNNDYKTFVSFLTLPNEKTQISPDELQEILAGISEITEEFQKQNDIVSSLMELNKFEQRNRESAKKFAKEKIESEYIKQIRQIETENQRKLDEKEKSLALFIEKKIGEMQKEFKKKSDRERIERINERISVYESQLKDKNNMLAQIKASCNKKKKVLKFFMISILVIYVMSIIILNIFCGWEKIEPFTYICGLILSISIIIVSISLSRKLCFWEIPSAFYDKCLQNELLKWDFEESEITDLEETISILKQEKNDLEKDLE